MSVTVDSERTSGVAALERGLTILAAFGGGDLLSLGELAAITGLYKSTILRLSVSLQRFGFLQRLDDGRFRLGPASFLLGRAYQRSFRLAELVVPVLRRLAATSGETASLYVRQGDADVCLHRVASSRPVRDAGIAEGDRFPADDDSAGAVVTSAFLGADSAQAEAVRRGLVVLSRHSRRVPGAAALACPVFGVDQTLVGTLLLSGPETRFTDAAVEAMAGTIAAQAAMLTRALGGDATALELLSQKEPGWWLDLDAIPAAGAATPPTPPPTPPPPAPPRLTDSEWDRLRPLIPPARPGGRPRKTDMRAALEAVLFLRQSGGPWRSLPRQHFPPRGTVYNLVRGLERDGIWHRIEAELSAILRQRTGDAAVKAESDDSVNH